MRETGGRIHKAKKPHCTSQDFQCICACLFVSRAAQNAWPASPPHTHPPPHYTLNKTSFVSRTAECEPPPPHCAPLPRLPGQQNSLSWFIKSSSAGLCCPTRAHGNTTSNAQLPHSGVPQSLWGLCKAYISSSLMGLWESQGERKERKEGAGIEYQVEKRWHPGCVEQRSRRKLAI